MEQENPPAPTADPAPQTPVAQGHCENCDAPLYGRYCYACGQPTSGMVRHFSSVMSDVADSVLNIDERVFRTLAPLYLRPARLTLDYFAGKRARYVTPFRLVFFLAIIALFAIQLTVRAGFSDTERNIQLSGATAPPAQTTGDAVFANGNISFDGKRLWNRASKPFNPAWLPDFASALANDLIDNAQRQLHAMNSGSWADRTAAQHQFKLGLLAAAPTVLFLLLPVFALILKVFYIFKRRLYMEHLIVAMHSHAFLMLSILSLAVLGALRQWLVPPASWLGVPLGLCSAAAWIWMFAYLLVMQKRIYCQGWAMTAWKFAWIGLLYSFLLIFAIVLAVLLTLTGA